MNSDFDRKRRWLKDLPARTALKLLNHSLVRKRLGQRHEAALRCHHSSLPALNGFDRGIVDALERDGVFVTSLDALGLPDSTALVSTAFALAARYADTARERAAQGQEFTIVPGEWIASTTAIYAWGLHDRLLDIAECYLGLPPAFDGASVNYTIADGREVSTRKWHRDWEDRRMLKVAVYLHDVGADGGPFEIIRRMDSSQSDIAGFRYELADDQELAARLGESFADDILSCEGPIGTVIFNDTARFYHRGKPATAQDRAALFYSYFANPPRHPFLCERTGLKREHIATLSRGLPKRQLAAAQWRQNIPLLLTMISPASL